MQNSKNAFTMIELIFVIVILGILAAVAIPKLAATRSDAKVVSELTSAAQALQNLGSEFTAKGSFSDYTVTDANNAVECFVFTLDNATDGNISLSVIGAASGACPSAIFTDIKVRAANNGLTAAGGGTKPYSFAGTGVIE